VTTGCNDLDNEGDYWSASGTSFAAPHVAGALALMLDLFPNMTPQDALSALLVTATDYVSTTPDFVSGVTAGVGTDQVGGRGILNLARAFAPIARQAGCVVDERAPAPGQTIDQGRLAHATLAQQ
jgi:subtilisin family serine protease